MRIFGKNEKIVSARVKLLSGFEEVGKAFRSCEGALHRLYSSMVLVF